MKNYKTSRILVLVLSLALLIGTAVGFAASATETTETTPEIEAINVYYKDVIYVAIAVNTPVEADAAANPDITVKYVIDGEEIEKTATYVENRKIWENNGEKNDQNYYPVYVTEGIAAKNQGDDVTAWVVDNANGTSSATKNVSVASYLYQRLYKDGIIAATEEAEVAKRDFYLAHLDYIAGAQKVLYNNATPAPETPKALVTDYIAVYAQDTIINGGDSFYLMKEAGNVTLEYVGEGIKGFWNVSTYNGSAVTATSKVSGNTVSLTSSAIITPTLLDFEIGAPTKVETFENSYKENIVTIADGTINCPSFGDYITTSFSTTKYNTTGETVAELVEYTTAQGTTSKALNLFTPGRVDSEGNAYDNNRAHSMTIKVMEDVVPEGKANATAFEFDFKLGFDTSKSAVATGVYTAPMQLCFDSPKEDGASSRAYVQYNPTVDATTGIMKFKTVTGTSFEIGKVNEFVTLKFVVDYDDELIHVYVNGVLKGSIDAVEYTSSSAYTHSSTEPTYWPLFQANGVTRLGINIMATTKPNMSDFYIDNVKSYNTYCLD